MNWVSMHRRFLNRAIDDRDTVVLVTRLLAVKLERSYSRVNDSDRQRWRIISRRGC